MLRWWKGTYDEKWGTWVVVTMFLAVPFIHAINVSWCSRNSNSIRTRAVSAAIYNMMAQAGSMISSQLYQPSDKPYYYKGNTSLLGISIGTALLLILTKFYYVARNRFKDRAWNKLTKEEQEDYIQNTKDEGARRLDFRFVH